MFSKVQPMRPSLASASVLPIVCWLAAFSVGVAVAETGQPAVAGSKGQEAPTKAAAAAPAAGQTKTQPAASSAKKPDKPGKGKPAKAEEYLGPNETDIRTAYNLRVDRINDGTKKYLSPEAAARMQILVKKVGFNECNKVDQRTDLYLCTIVVESAIGNGEAEFKRVEARFAKEGRVWTMR